MFTHFPLQVDSVDVSPLAATVAVGLSCLEGNTWDGQIKLLSLSDGREISSVYSGSGVKAIKFIQSGNFLAAARDDGSISLFSSDLSVEAICIEAHDTCVSSITPSPHHPSRLLSTSWDGSIKLWDLEKCMVTAEYPTVDIVSRAHFRRSTDTAFYEGDASSGNVFCSGGQDGFVRLWDQRMNLHQGCVGLYSHSVPISCVCWDISQNQDILAGTEDGQIIRFDLRIVDNEALGSSSICGRSLHALSFSDIHRGQVNKIQSIGRNMILSCSNDATAAFSASCYSGVPAADSSIESHQADFTVQKRLSYHTDYVSDMYVSDVSDGSQQDGYSHTLITGSWDKSVAVNYFSITQEVSEGRGERGLAVNCYRT